MADAILVLPSDDILRKLAELEKTMLDRQEPKSTSNEDILVYLLLILPFFKKEQLDKLDALNTVDQDLCNMLSMILTNPYFTKRFNIGAKKTSTGKFRKESIKQLLERALKALNTLKARKKSKGKSKTSAASDASAASADAVSADAASAASADAASAASADAASFEELFHHFQQVALVFDQGKLADDTADDQLKNARKELKKADEETSFQAQSTLANAERSKRTSSVALEAMEHEMDNHAMVVLECLCAKIMASHVGSFFDASKANAIVRKKIGDQTESTATVFAKSLIPGLAAQHNLDSKNIAVLANVYWSTLEKGAKTWEEDVVIVHDNGDGTVCVLMHLNAKASPNALAEALEGNAKRIQYLQELKTEMHQRVHLWASAKSYAKAENKWQVTCDSLAEAVRMSEYFFSEQAVKDLMAQPHPQYDNLQGISNDLNKSLDARSCSGIKDLLQQAHSAAKDGTLDKFFPRISQLMDNIRESMTKFKELVPNYQDTIRELFELGRIKFG